MKRFLILLSLLFCNTVCAETININWMVDGQQYVTPTTCEYSGDVILPTPPTKYGYTFAGWEPGGYIFLEYIEGLNNTQYIDTGIAPTVDMSIYGKFQYISDIGHNANFCFGTRTKENGLTKNYGVYGFVHESFIGLDFFGTNQVDRYIVNDNRTVNDIYEFNIKNSKATIIKNGTILGEHTFTPTCCVNYNLFLNALAENGQITFSDVNTVRNRIYNFKIEGIADMRPAIRVSDDAVGMYDLIRGTFFENSGTGTFIAGPVAN